MNRFTPISPVVKLMHIGPVKHNNQKNLFAAIICSRLLRRFDEIASNETLLLKEIHFHDLSFSIFSIWFISSDLTVELVYDAFCSAYTSFCQTKLVQKCMMWNSTKNSMLSTPSKSNLSHFVTFKYFVTLKAKTTNFQRQVLLHMQIIWSSKDRLVLLASRFDRYMLNCSSTT